MKPWPKELAALYPLPLGVVPERPWWTPQGPCAERSDGLVIQRGFSGLSLPDLVSEKYKFPSMMKEADEAKPLPHPGFRVGQVWATPQEADEFLVRVIQAQDTGSVLRHWYMDFWRSEEELQSELRESYLLTDPCCPWLAPWSPS